MRSIVTVGCKDEILYFVLEKQCLPVAADSHHVQVSDPAASEIAQLTTGRWSASFLGGAL